MAQARLLNLAIVYEIALEEGGKQVSKRISAQINIQPTSASVQRAFEIMERVRNLTEKHQSPRTALEQLSQKGHEEVRFNQLIDLGQPAYIIGELDRPGAPFDQALVPRASLKLTEESDLPWEPNIPK